MADRNNSTVNSLDDHLASQPQQSRPRPRHCAATSNSHDASAVHSQSRAPDQSSRQPSSPPPESAPLISRRYVASFLQMCLLVPPSLPRVGPVNPCIFALCRSQCRNWTKFSRSAYLSWLLARLCANSFWCSKPVHLSNICTKLPLSSCALLLVTCEHVKWCYINQDTHQAAALCPCQ